MLGDRGRKGRTTMKKRCLFVLCFVFVAPYLNSCSDSGIEKMQFDPVYTSSGLITTPVELDVLQVELITENDSA